LKISSFGDLKNCLIWQIDIVYVMNSDFNPCSWNMELFHLSHTGSTKQLILLSTVVKMHYAHHIFYFQTIICTILFAVGNIFL